jgi:hypothetical protein
MANLKVAEQLVLLVVASGSSVQTSKTNSDYVRLEFDAVGAGLNVLNISLGFFKSIKSKWIVNNPLIITVDVKIEGETGYLDEDNNFVAHEETGYHLCDVRQATKLSINRFKDLLSEQDMIDLKESLDEVQRYQRAISL